MITCKKEEEDKIKPVEVPFHSRVEIDYSGVIINDGDWIEIDGVRYTHKLDSFNITSVLDSGYLLTTIKADSLIVIDTISIDTTGSTVDSFVTQITELQPPQIDTTQITIIVTEVIDTSITIVTTSVIDPLTGDTTINYDTVTTTSTQNTYDTTYITQITYFNDTIYDYVTTYTIDYATAARDTVIITTNNYHNPGGSLLLMLLRKNSFIQSLDTTNKPPNMLIVMADTADLLKPQISHITPQNVSLWDTFNLTIGNTTIPYVATEPTSANVIAGLSIAINDSMTTNPAGDWAKYLSSATAKPTYIELKGKIDTAFTVISGTLNGSVNFAAKNYILKVKGGEILNIDNMFDIRNALDWRAKTIQIESKTGSEIKIEKSYSAKITYY